MNHTHKRNPPYRVLLKLKKPTATAAATTKVITTVAANATATVTARESSGQQKKLQGEGEKHTNIRTHIVTN